MAHRLLLKSIITILILELSNPLEHKAAHKHNLINRFCIASLKPKLKRMNKEKIDEISHFTCECFSKKYKSGSSLKISRDYCKKRAADKYNLQ